MIYERFQAVARAHADQAALIDAGMPLTYGGLLDRVDALAGTLARDVGVREADTVLALLPNTAEFVALFLAVAKLGAVVMPIDPALRDRELGAYLERFDVRAAVTSAALQSQRPGDLTALARDRWLTAEALTRPAGGVTRMHRAGPFEGVLVALSTSGSTGVPKVVGRTHRGLLAGFAGLCGAIGVVPGDRVLGVTPFSIIPTGSPTRCSSRC